MAKYFANGLEKSSADSKENERGCGQRKIVREMQRKCMVRERTEPVMGAPYREVNSKVATTPKLKVEDRDKVDNSPRMKMVKLNIVKLKASRKLVLLRKSWL